jgi:hypothetical protein
VLELHLPDSAQLLQQELGLEQGAGATEQSQGGLLRREEAAAQRLRQAHAGVRPHGARGPEDWAHDKGLQHLAACVIEFGHKLIETGALLAHGAWLPWPRGHCEMATPTGVPLYAVHDALCRAADAAMRWEVNPSGDNDRRLTRLVEQAQDAVAQAYPPTETTLRLLQHIAPDGLKLAIIQCENSGRPLIAISIDADHTLRWRQAAGADVPPAPSAGRLSGYVRRIAPFATSR